MPTIMVSLYHIIVIDDLPFVNNDCYRIPDKDELIEEYKTERKDD